MHHQQQLKTIQRNTPAGGPATKDRRTWLLMAGLAAGAALLFMLIFGHQLRPRVTVVTAPVLLLETSKDDAATPAETVASGTMVAQASGWIEPDPFPVMVPVKTDGFVETVEVLEGETVTAGDLLATLDATNAMLAVQRLEAHHARAEATLQMATHQLTAASSAVNRAEATVKAAQARFDEASDRNRRIAALPDEDVSPVERIAAARAEEEASASLVDARSSAETARATLLAREADRAEKEAALQSSIVMLNEVRLAMERTRVYAPFDGVVLERFVAPGMKRMAGMDDMTSSAIVSLYDPARLQVRVDVPLADVGKIDAGSTARIMTAAFPNRVFTGRVTRITGEADITRNTLQVKVALQEPDPRMRPEMLCRVEFLDTGKTAAGSGARAIGQSLWIPDGALIDPPDAEGRATVWVVDVVNETATPRVARIGSARREGRVEALDGLLAGERVVIEGQADLKPGALVNRREEGETP